MSDSAQRLVLKLEGPLVEDYRLPLSELQRVAQLVRGTLRSIALVLTDEGPGRQSGRVKRFIETSVDLEVVGAPRAGSFVLDMEVPPSSAKDQPDLELRAGPHIGDRAVRALVSGLAALDEDTVQLPEGFDRGVLQAVAGLRNTLIRGVDRVVLTTSGNEGPEGRAEVDASRVALVKTLISRPIRSHAIAEGTLRMVDDATLECRLERPPLPSITCFFEDKDRDAVWEAAKGRQHVRVIGEGEYLPGESHPRRLWAASITVVSEVLPFDPDAFWLPRSLDDLADEQAVQTFSPRPLDDEWRDDAEAAALIAALADDERHGHGH